LSDEQWERIEPLLPSNAGRNVVERSFALAKQWRALATRYDKLAITCRGAVVLSACITWTRI
jgi:transposase